MIEKAILNRREFYIFENDTGVSKTIRENGVYAFGEMKIYKDILKDGGVFVDVGANIGAISFQLRQHIPNLIVYGFEPIEAFFQLAVKNLSKFENINLYPCGIGANAHEIMMPKVSLDEKRNFGALTLIERDGFEKIQIRTLDEFKNKFSHPPRLIKVDVEGQEDQVLKGMESIFHPDLVLSLEADRPKTAKSCIEMLKSRGMRIFLGRLRINSPFESGRNKGHDLKSAIHLLACYGEPTHWMRRILTEIDSYAEYIDLAGPTLMRSGVMPPQP